MYANQSKILKVKEFLSKNSDLLTAGMFLANYKYYKFLLFYFLNIINFSYAGTHDNLLAFFLLPLCVKSVFSKKEESLTKEEIANSFILHVKVSTLFDGFL